MFHIRVPYNVQDLKKGIRPPILPTLNSQYSQDVSNKRKGFSMMSAKEPCKLISNTKRTVIKKANASNSMNNNICIFCSLKQITREVKSSSQTFGGYALILLKRPHQITINSYENSDRTKPKSFIA